MLGYGVVTFISLLMSCLKIPRISTLSTSDEEFKRRNEAWDVPYYTAQGIQFIAKSVNMHAIVAVHNWDVAMNLNWV